MTVKFNAGDRAIYPTHGVVTILRVESRYMNGISRNGYVASMSSPGGSAMLFVPFGSESQVGLRQPASKAEALEVLKRLETSNATERLSSVTWNRRRRGYMDKLRAGGLLEVAEVFKDLHVHKTLKGRLSYEERKLLNATRLLIVDEITLSLKCQKTDIETRLAAITGASN